MNEKPDDNNGVYIMHDRVYQRNKINFNNNKFLACIFMFLACMVLACMFIYTINIQVLKYRFSKNSFNLVLNVANGSFFNSLSKLFHNPTALYRKLLCPVVVEHRGICSLDLGLLVLFIFFNIQRFFT